MQIQWISKNICYDGSQLKPHWVYQQTDLLGDALVAWVGPADVTLTHMLDVEDVKAKAPITSPKMLHFLGEFFQLPLSTGVALQRIFILLLKDSLVLREVSSLIRSGDDLYWQETETTKKKLSVSIATVSPVSTLLHVGINVETQGTPVPTIGLADWKIEPQSLGFEIMTQFQKEFLQMRRASYKVRPVL